MARSVPGSFGLPGPLSDGWPVSGELLLATTKNNDDGAGTVQMPTSSPAGMAYRTVTNSTDYSVTSTTFIDMDVVNLSLTITIGARRRVLVCAAVDHNMMVAAEFGYLDLSLDGVRIGTTTNGLARRGPEVSSGRGKISFAYLTKPLTGPHTFNLMCRVSAGTGRFGLMYWGGGSTTFSVMERA